MILSLPSLPGRRRRELDEYGAIALGAEVHSLGLRAWPAVTAGTADREQYLEFTGHDLALADVDALYDALLRRLLQACPVRTRGLFRHRGGLDVDLLRCSLAANLADPVFQVDGDVFPLQLSY